MRQKNPIDAPISALIENLSSEQSRRAYQGDWGRFVTWLTLEGVEVLEARPRHVTAHVAHLSKTMERSTVSRALSVIRAIYGALVLDELIETNPAREVKVRRVPYTPKAPWMTGEQMKMLIDAMPRDSWRDRRNWLVIRAMSSLGWRREEIAHMHTRDIKGTVASVTVKGGKKSRVGIPPSLLADIKAWCKYAGIEDGPVFPRSQDKVDSPISGSIVYNIVKEAGDRVGLTNITPHSFRRSMLTYLRGRGVEGSALQAAVMHQSFSTTEKYLKADKAAEQSPGELVLEMMDKVKE